MLYFRRLRAREGGSKQARLTITLKMYYLGYSGEI